jgi:hypothetical protein
MRCNNCGKTVPNTTINCPYCSQKIDPNQLYVDKSIVEEEQTPTSTKDKLLSFARKRENKSIVIGFAVVAVFIVIIIILGIMSLFNKNNKPDAKLFQKYVSNTYDHLVETFIPNNGNSGKYSLTASVDEKQYHYEGEYNLKIIDRYFDLTGSKSDLSNSSDIIISEEENFSFETYLLKNLLYINSKDFYNKDLYYELPDKSNFLTTNKLNVKALTNGVYDTFIEVLKDLNYSTSKETIEIANNSFKTYKLSYEFDKDTKLKLIKEIAEIVKEDSSFVNEYSKMSGKSKNDVLEMIEGYKSTLTYKVKNSNIDSSYLNVYVTSSDVKRIEVILVTENDTYNIELSFGNNTDYINVKKNKADYIDFSITKTDKELANGVHKTLSFVFRGLDHNISGDLVLDTNSKPNVRRKTASPEAVNAYNLSPEEKESVKNKIQSLMGYNWFDNLIDYVKPICSNELNCNCNDETNSCICNQGTTFVTCTKEEINKENKEG